MMLRSIVVAFVLLSVSSLFLNAQQESDYHTVVLKVKERAVVKDPTVELITLASGAQITLKKSDIDYALSSKLADALRVSGSPSTPSAAPSGDSAAVIRAKCEKEWSGDFQMRQYCETQQKTAVANLQQRPMASADQRTIRSKCLKEWPGDYQMQNYCEEQQLKALEQLSR